MNIHETGLLPASSLFFHTPSETARALFFYPLCCGHYFCNEEYRVARSSYDSFMLAYVVKGEGYVVSGGIEQAVPTGSALLLDCYKPHVYGTHSAWEIVWVHFDGQMARRYFNTISPQAGYCIHITEFPHSTERCLYKIFEMFHKKGVVSEAQANKYIVGALTEYFTTASPPAGYSSAISEELLAYIAENIQSRLSVEDLAKRAMLSPYYFSRIFKKETGYTPHEYVMLARINAARFYLKTTALPLKKISSLCGFSTVGRFCTAFKDKTGFTPAGYRAQAQ